MKLRNYERIMNIQLDGSSNIDIANVTLVCDDPKMKYRVFFIEDLGMTLRMSGKILERISEHSTVILISFNKKFHCYLSPKSFLVGGGWWWWDLPIIESISRSRPETWEWLWVSIDLLVIWSSPGHGLDPELDNTGYCIWYGT